MNLHRSDKVPDWEKVPENQRNIFQRTAAKTNGVVTPGNVISVAGLAITLSGLKDMHDGQYTRGTVKIGVGRLCDMADGFAADKTGTKSALGEAVDAFIDKVVMAVGLLVLRKADIVPRETARAFAVQNGVNALATGVAKMRGVDLHPTEKGKKTAWAQWMTLGGRSLGAALEHGGVDSDVREILGAATEVCSEQATVLGQQVNIDYLGTALFAQPVQTVPDVSQPTYEATV